MPAGLIENDDRMGTSGYCCGDLIEVKLHGFGVAERQNQVSLPKMASGLDWQGRAESSHHFGR
jgi:hypothetical protein